MKKWTKEDTAILKQNMDNSLNLLKQLLPDKSEDMIIEKIRLLYRKEFNNRWTEGELDILKNNINTSVFDLLPLLPNRTFTAISYKRYTLNLDNRPRAKRVPKTSWTGEELERLDNLKNEGYTNFEISEILKRPLNSVMGKLYTTGKVFNRFKKKTWSEEDTAYLLESIKNKVSIERIADNLNTTTNKVLQKAIHLGYNNRDFVSDNKNSIKRERELRAENAQLKKDLSHNIRIIKRIEKRFNINI